MGAELSPTTLILEDSSGLNKVTILNTAGVLSITPAVDDTGSIIFGSATKGFDVKIFLGAADQYVLFDRGAASVTFAKLDVALSGDLAITVEDISLGDDNDLEFGDGTDVLMRWSTGDASNHALVLALDDTSQQMHITDKGAVATDWARSAGTHPELAIHSNTTPITDYLAIGNHDGTTAHIDVVGGTTLSLDIAGAAEVTLTASALSPAASDGNALGTATLMWADLFLANEAVINFNNGDVTLTHAANLLTIGGGTVTLSDTTDASSLTAGALVVAGGIACAKQLYLGDDIDMSVSGTGTYDITLKDNVADALSIVRGTTDMIVFTSTTASPLITITPATTITGALTASSTLGIVGLITSTSVTGFRSNPTFVPDANRTNYTLAVGFGHTDTNELAITMAAAATQHLDPIALNLNIIGANPAGSSTINGIYQLITHDTIDMSYLRLKNTDFNVVVGRDILDAYCYQGEIEFNAADIVVGGEACVMGLVMNAGTSAVTGGVRGLKISMGGSGMPATSAGLSIDAATAAVLGYAIYIETQGGTTINEGIHIVNAPTGTFTDLIYAGGTITNFLNLASAGNSGFVTTGGTDCTASGATDPSYTIKIINPAGTAGYIRVWAAA